MTSSDYEYFYDEAWDLYPLHLPHCDCCALEIDINILVLDEHLFNALALSFDLPFNSGWWLKRKITSYCKYILS